jgi:hypothetical protein
MVVAEEDDMNQSPVSEAHPEARAVSLRVSTWMKIIVIATKTELRWKLRRCH